jgi:hypothetical protein
MRSVSDDQDVWGNWPETLGSPKSTISSPPLVHESVDPVAVWLFGAAALLAVALVVAAWGMS